MHWETDFRHGDVFGKAKYLIETFGSTGQGSNSDGEIEKYNLSNYDGSFYVKNENDEKKIILNNKSFVGFYVGEHEYTLECDYKLELAASNTCRPIVEICLPELMF